MKTLTPIAVFGCAAFAYGVAVGHYKIFPHPLIQGAYSAAFAEPKKEPAPEPKYTTVPGIRVRSADIEALIRVKSIGDAAQIRRDLIRFVWKQDTLPRDLPKVEREGSDPRLVLKHAAGSDRLLISMEHGFSSTAYVLHPQKPNGSAIVFHQGHNTTSLLHQADVIDALLHDGHTVALLSMPLHGLNYGTVDVATKQFGVIRIKDHDQLQLLRSESFEPFKLYLHPVALTVNFLSAEGFKTISLYGFSGGAWTITVYAAVDPRPKGVFPAAGSIPLYLRGHDPVDGWGDHEQYDPALYRIAEYPDLYVVGSLGRRHVQILNQFDGCCFGGVGSKQYAPSIARRVQQIGGSYALFLDDTHRTHELSPAALQRLKEELARLQQGA